jgi:cyclophilin family peptidyl-prolyl cis-trans isomerase
MNPTVICLVVLFSGGMAQPDPEAPAPTAVPVVEADPELEALTEVFRNLYDSLRARGGVTVGDHEVIGAVREQAAAYNAAHPDSVRGLALELQLSRWLGDQQRVHEIFARLATATGDVEIGLAWARYNDGLEEAERIDGIYERLAELFPGAPEVRLGQARSLISANQYGAALAILEQAQIDPATHPKAALTLSECLFAEQRYQAALEALEAIPQETLDADPAVKRAVDRDLPVRREYVELWDQEQQIRSTEAAAGDLPQVEILTSRGRIVVELFENEAPNTVANFISLAEQDFYDGSTFHRVLANFMSQGGDPNSKPGASGSPGTGGPGYRIADEHDRDGARMHFTGSLAMAKQEPPHTAGCQFYLTHTATAHLNGRHTVFGRVLEGLDVARAMEVGDVIESVNVLSKRDHDYTPQTLPETPVTPPDDLPTSLELSPTQRTIVPTTTPPTIPPSDPE